MDSKSITPKRTPYYIMKSASDKSFMPTDKEMDSVNPFFLIRMISNSPETIYIANTLNIYAKDIPNKAQYLFVRNSTLDDLKYFKFKDDSIDKRLSKKDIEFLSDFYKCSIDIAKDYASIMGYDEVKKISIKYIKGKKG